MEVCDRIEKIVFKIRSFNAFLRIIIEDCITSRNKQNALGTYILVRQRIKATSGYSYF
jgi:hypothetical protein